jgi:hypothetical protein
VPGERELAGGREDPHPVVGLGLGRGEDERGLGEVRPVGDAKHLVVGETVAVEHDRQRVPEERHGGEHVHLFEASQHSPNATRASVT